ncbi:MAG TPA: hypothetical protein VM487_18595 [Phycisphaerae bacterium]|nr:hypothetical protein [Phycisphaerae bacterium]
MTQFLYGSYTHPTPPTLVVERQVRRQIDDAGRIESITWRLEGFLDGADSAAIKTAVDGLEAAYRIDNQDAQLKSGSTVLMILDASEAVHGVQVDGPHFPQGGGVEFATLRRYQITLTAEFIASGTSYDEDSRLSYDYDPAGLATVTSSGTLRTKRGTSADALFASKDPDPGATYQLQHRRKTLNGLEDTQLDWEYVYREGKVATPAGVESASVTQVRRVDPDGTSVYYTVAGHLEGANPLGAVPSFHLAYVLLSESVTTDKYTGAVDFTLEYLSLGESRALVSWVETIEIVGGGMHWYTQPLCGKAPKKVETVLMPATAVQSGRMVGRTTWRPFPTPKWGPEFEHLDQRRQVKLGASRVPIGSHIHYPTEYAYYFEFPDRPAMKNPGMA